MGTRNDGMVAYLENKKVYTVYDNGYFYSHGMKTCDTKEEAISYWEEVTGKPYAQYDEHIKNAPRHLDGHWYYSVEEDSLIEYLNEHERRAIDNAICKKEEEICDNGNKRIEIAATKDERYRIANIMRGLYYYLERTIGYNDIGYDMDDKYKLFVESLKGII